MKIQFVQNLLVHVFILIFSCVFAQNENKLPYIKYKIWNASNDQVFSDNNIEESELYKLSNFKTIDFKGGIILEGDVICQKRNSFGGLSAIEVSKNGEIATVISDYSSVGSFCGSSKYQSKWYKLKLDYDNFKTLIKATLIEQGNLKNEKGNIIDGKVESIASIGNKLYLSSDQDNKLLVFSSLNKKALDNITFSKCNVNVEAITHTKIGGLLAIEEGNCPGYRDVWIITPKTKSHSMSLYKSNYDKVAGATTLDNGDILLLEKSFDENKSSTKMALMLLKSDDIRKDKLITTPILEVDYSIILDNFEGITSYENNGKKYVLIVSDDNGDRSNNAQRTLLLHFELKF